MCMVKEAQGMELLKKEITVVYGKMLGFELYRRLKHSANEGMENAVWL